MNDRRQNDRLTLLRLARTRGVGPVTWRRLLAGSGDPDEALDRLAALPREGGRLVPVEREVVEREAEALDRLGGRFVLLDEPDYPPALAATQDPPVLVSVLGPVASLARPSVALVGARNASANGRRFAESLAGELALAGLTVVSGLARGIDAAAHAGALGQGRTIAAIAGGLDRPYPPEHATLQHEIVARGGAVVAEQRLGTEPIARHFPRRNRIVAGLALGCVVVEAAPRSGSLITARMALDEGRELFAVPGSPLDPRSRGSNDLLRQGHAHLCEGAADVLAHLPTASNARVPADPSPRTGRIPATVAPAPSLRAETADQTDAVRRAVLELLGPAPAAIDDLIRRCQFSASLVTAALAELELAGRVETLPGSRVCLVPP